MSYFDEDDHKHTARYKESTPDVMKSWVDFNVAVFAEEGREIPLKYRELIALAVTLTTQCVYCIEGHSKKAVSAGATQGELAEAAWVATAIRAGGAFSHGRLAFKFGLHDASHA